MSVPSMNEERFSVVVTRGTVTSAAAQSVPRAMAWGVARTLRGQGYRVWIVSEDFSRLFVADDQSLDERRAAAARIV